MKTIRHFAMLTLVILLVFSSCNKDEGTATTLKSKKDLLTAYPWGYESRKVNGVVTAIETCQKDDILTFLPAGTYTQSPNGTFCNPNDKLISGTWALSSDEKTIAFDGVTLFSILELTSSKLVVYYGTSANNTEATLIPVK